MLLKHVKTRGEGHYSVRHISCPVHHSRRPVVHLRESGPCDMSIGAVDCSRDGVNHVEDFAFH